MGRGDIDIIPLEGMFFDSTKIWNEPCRINGVECKTNKNLEDANTLYFYCFELGNVLVFYHKGKLRSNILLELPISDIISVKAGSEKKRIGKKWITTIKTAGDTIVIQGDEDQVHAFKEILDEQKEKQELVMKTKKITLTSGGSTKTITIHPYSPAAQDGEESIFSLTSSETGFLVTNYRVFMNSFLGGLRKTQSLTHGEYEDVIASNVEKRREEDIVGGVEETPSFMTAFLAGANIHNPMQVYYNKSTHHASSTETEVGDVIFMNDGKQVMAWKNFPDPNSLVKIINSAKAHFKTAPATSPSSGGEDPIKALKLRFAKGEITKKQFLEMKKILE